MLLPRGPLTLNPRLMLTTDTTDVVMDMDMLPMDALPMPMVHTHVPMDTDTTTDMDMVVKPHKTNKRNHSNLLNIQFLSFHTKKGMGILY